MQNKKTWLNLLAGFLITGLVLLFPQDGFAAAKITDYDQKVLVSTDGTGNATATIVIKDLTEGRVTVPLPTGSIKDFRIDGLPAQIKATPILKGDAPPHLILAISQGAPTNIKITMNFGIQVAKKNPENKKYELSHQIINVGDMVIEKYHYVLSLPTGDAFHSLTSIEPKSKTGTGAEMVFNKVDNLHESILTYKNIKIGDRVGMKLLAEPESKSPLWLLLGFIISALYLYFFRDLVTDLKKNKSQQVKAAG